MSNVPFTATLRTRRTTVALNEGADAITIRVEMPEVWDVVRIQVAPTQPALAVKMAALAALYPEAEGEFHADFVLKFRGWEVLDEAATLADLGVINGSILLLTHRRRRPVR
jgi:hypothetical protein